MEYNSDLITKIDEVGGATTYIGLAQAGTASSDASWKIQKMTVTGTLTEVEFASGSNQFNNIWDDRVGLSYS